MHLKEAPLDVVLRMFEDMTGLTFDVQPKTQASVKVEAEDIPWELALTKSLESVGYGWTREGSTVKVRPLPKTRR